VLANEEEGPRIKVLTVDVQDAKGAYWARSEIQRKLFNGEEFTLQIDCHMRFTRVEGRGWDTVLLD